MYCRALLLLFVGLSAYAAQNSGSGPAPASTKLGDYIVEAEQPSEICGIDKHGGVGQITQRIFYKDRLVTAISMSSFVSPWNPSRLLFSVAIACAVDEEHTGTFYFGGTQDAPVRVNYGGTDASPEALRALWSPDDKFVAVPANGMEFFLLNLQTGQSSNLSKLFYKQESLTSKVHFREWSPDGKMLAIVVSSIFTRPGVRMWFESDLMSIGAVSLEPTYVATIRKEDGWQKGQFVWVSKAGGFDLAVDPSLRNSAAIVVKPPPSSPPPKTSN
jgi:WD40 repeat protein